MYNSIWVEVPFSARHRKISPELETLRDTFHVAEKIAFQLLCASNQLQGLESPEVTACAAVFREAVHKPEKDRANAIKAAEAAVLKRRVNYVSAVVDYQQHMEEWQNIRSTLVTQLEAVITPTTEPGFAGIPRYVDIDLMLNCEAVADLIEKSDISVNEARARRYHQPTEKYAQAGFQAVFDALAAEVAGPRWLGEVRFSFNAGSNTEILRDIFLEKIYSSSVPTEFAKCSALDSARVDFERIFNHDLTMRCREFRQETTGTVNDTQLSERLLAAVPDVSAMMRIEEQRDARLRKYGLAWRWNRSLIEAAIVLFVKVAELLPEAIAEAAAIEDETMRRRAQNLCLFAASRLKSNLGYVRDCSRFVPDHVPNNLGISAAVGRSHKALVERIASKQLRTPSGKCRLEPYLG